MAAALLFVATTTAALSMGGRVRSLAPLVRTPASRMVLQSGDLVTVIGASGNVGKLVALRLADTVIWQTEHDCTPRLYVLRQLIGAVCVPISVPCARCGA